MVDENPTDVDGVVIGTVDGVDDVCTANGTASGLPAALISLCTDERLLRVVGIVTPHEYLKYTKRNKIQHKSKVGNIN